MTSRNSKSENYLREYAFIFFAQKKVILSVALVIFLLTAAVAFLWPSTWAATGSFLVKGRTDKNVADLEETKRLLDRTRKEDLFSEAAILTSNDVILLAVKELNEGERYSGPPLTPSKVKPSIKAEVLPSSNVIEITLSWSNPKDAETILDALMNNYLRFRTELYNPSRQKQVFDSRSRNYMKNIEDKQEGLLDAIKQEKAPDPGLEIKQNLEIKQGNTRKLIQFREELTDAEFLIKQIDSDLQSKRIKFYTYIDIDSITVLNSKLQELVLRRNSTLKTYSAESDRAKAIRKEVIETSSLLRSEVASYKRKLEDIVKALKVKIRLLQDEINRIDERNLVLKALDLKLKNIDRESKLFSLSFDTFFKRKEEADFINTSSKIASYVSVIAAAHALDEPVFPNKRVLLPLGLLTGILMGFAIGFIREFMDHRFKRPEDVEKYLGLPVILSLSELSMHGADSPAQGGRNKSEDDTKKSGKPPSAADQKPGDIDPDKKFSTLLGWNDKDPRPLSDE